MGTSNPSRPKGKRAGSKAESRTALVFRVSLAAREDAPPFLENRAGKAVLTDRGRLVAECWRGLGDGRPSLEPDEISIGPRTVDVILRLKDSGQTPLSLPAAIRLFKATASRALAGSSASAPKPAGSIWQKGYKEKRLTTLKQVVEARAALRKSNAS